MKKTVIELFAGVGGFRVGLNNIKGFDETGKAIENGSFNFVWANQWEPATKTQHAFNCYTKRFGESEFHSNQDISVVNKKDIPNHTLLCGGFPCQDYSVAHSLSKEKGIEGKKGVLWWQIRDILEIKKPPFVFLENVDRLLLSPAKQRGRDFGIMLKCFADLGYSVEWRVINASDYGMPQRRRRLFIFACKQGTNYYKTIVNSKPEKLIDNDGVFAKSFPVEKKNDYKSVDLSSYNDLVDLSSKFKYQFENTGVLINQTIYTSKTTPIYETIMTLGMIADKNVDKHYYLDKKQREKFKFLRGSKKIPRTRPDGSPYFYTEGSMSPVDSLDKPGRTMLTSEGSINRSTHIVEDKETGKIRFLTPIECERLQQFPDNWTEGCMPERRRYFMMGNALVCGIISRVGKQIEQIIDKEK